MLKTKSVTENFVSPLELNPQLNNKTLLLSSRQLDWNGILVEQYQNLPTSSEKELPTLSDHWLILPLGHPGHLTQNKSLTRVQLQQAIDYIHTHLDRDLSLVEIAKVINISPTYFASLFKRAIGTSPHQYVIGQRVERAKLMLSKTDLAIADIALQVGFSSQSHLTQHLKRLTGVTPKQIRFSP